MKRKGFMKSDHAFWLVCILTLSAQAASEISFQDPYKVDFEVSSPLRSLLAADFNGDGKVDLAVITEKSIWIFKGDGIGGFTPATELTLEQIPVQAAAADLNHDGRADLIVYQPQYDNRTGASMEEFVTFLSEGDFRCTPPLRFRPPIGGQLPPGGPFVLGFVVADLNLDGNPDLLLTRNGVGSDSVALGRGDGTFADPIRGPLTFMIAGAADFNSDGVPDVLISGIGGVPGPRVYYGRGDGSFHDPVALDVCDPLLGDCNLRIVDFDGDGKPDLLCWNASWGWVGNFRILRRDNHGAFEVAARFPDSMAGDNEDQFSLSFSDLNGDGVPDLIRTPSYYERGDSDNFAYIHAGLGSGEFADAVGIELPDRAQGTSVLFIDINGDNKPDLVATDGAQNLVIYLNTSGGN
jgi:hypothetical protein